MGAFGRFHPVNGNDYTLIRCTFSRMSSIRSGLRRAFAGKEVGAILGVLIVGSLFVPLFVPTYLAILTASGLRNVYLAWLGSGALFYAVAFGVLYLEAVVLTGVYLGARHIYRTVVDRPRNGTAA